MCVLHIIMNGADYQQHKHKTNNIQAQRKPEKEWPDWMSWATKWDIYMLTAVICLISRTLTGKKEQRENGFWP